MTERSLSLLCSQIVDCEHKTAPVAVDGDYFAIGTPAMKGNRINFDEARKISEETFRAWTRRLVPRYGDLLLAREAPVGPLIRIPREENVAPGQRTVLLRPDNDQVDSRFLYYFLTSPIQQERLRIKAAGSTVAHLNVADVRGFKLEVPPVAVQRAIAEVLGALDDKITANGDLAKVGEELLRAHIELLRLDDVEMPEVGSLAELVELNPRLPAPAEDEPVYLEMQALPTTGMSISSWTHRTPRGGARFQNGDTLLARITPCLENRKTGFVDFLDDCQIGLGSTEYIVMRSRPGVPRVLSYFIAVNDRFRTFAIRHMLGTSGRQRVNAGDLADYPICVPDLRALDDFGAVSEPITAMIASLRSENTLLATTRDTLLPQLMSGKLRVNDAEKLVEAVV